MDPKTGISGSSDIVPETTRLCYHFSSTRNTDFRYTFRSTYSVVDMNHFRNVFGPTETSLFPECEVLVRRFSYRIPGPCLLPLPYTYPLVPRPTMLFYLLSPVPVGLYLARTYSCNILFLPVPPYLHTSPDVKS
jgi:hypothetical protein